MDEDWAAPILKDDCLFSSTLSASGGFVFSNDDDLATPFGNRDSELHGLGFTGSTVVCHVPIADYPDSIDIKSEPNDESHIEYQTSEQGSPCSSLSSGADASMLTSLGGGTVRVSPRSSRILLSSQALPPVSHFSQIARSIQQPVMFYDDDLSPSPASSERSSPLDHPSGPTCFAARARSKMHEMAVKQRLITDQDPRGNGYVQLSPEEKRTLIQEGYALPTRLPLSKSEEEALKIVRRKIKNKLSAQESRRKRKEYMDTLEQRVQAYYTENTQLRNRIKQLETANRALQAGKRASENAAWSLMP